jgi:hypothetical protein
MLGKYKDKRKIIALFQNDFLCRSDKNVILIFFMLVLIMIRKMNLLIINWKIFVLFIYSKRANLTKFYIFHIFSPLNLI